MQDGRHIVTDPHMRSIYKSRIVLLSCMDIGPTPLWGSQSRAAGFGLKHVWRAHASIYAHVYASAGRMWYQSGTRFLLWKEIWHR